MNETIVLALLGILLSMYSLYVEHKAKKKSYKSMCDFNDNLSCTKAFTSSYGTTFGLKNGIWGILFYLMMIGLIVSAQSTLASYLAIISVLGSVYLAYVLFVKLKDFCLVCISIYLINILILITVL